MSKLFPSYRDCHQANFTWGSISASEFQPLIESAYAEVVHWCRNLFQVPSGSIGNKFVLELAKLCQAFADAASLESVAITAAMVMPPLSSCLACHLDSWCEGNIIELLRKLVQFKLN